MKSQLTLVFICVFVLSAFSLSAQTYYYAWGGAETEPQAAITDADVGDDNLWARRSGGTTEGGLADNFLEANDTTEDCPDLTLTVAAGSIDAGTYSVYIINGTGTGFEYNATVNDMANGEVRSSDMQSQWILIGLARVDGSTDLVIHGYHILTSSGRTRLDAIRLVRIDDLYYMWGGPETDNPTAFSWDWALLDMKYQLRDTVSQAAVDPNMPPDPSASPEPYEGNLPGLLLELDKDENAWDDAVGTAPDLTMTIPSAGVPLGTYTLYAWDGNSHANWGYELKAPGGDWVATAQYAEPWYEIGTFAHSGFDIVIESRAQMPWGAADRNWFWPIKLELVGDPSPTPEPITAAEEWTVYH